MDTYQKMIRAFEIFRKYPHDPAVNAEHDEMWAGPDAADVSDADIEELQVLGWHPEDDGQGFHHFT